MTITMGPTGWAWPFAPERLLTNVAYQSGCRCCNEIPRDPRAGVRAAPRHHPDRLPLRQAGHRKFKRAGAAPTIGNGVFPERCQGGAEAAGSLGPQNQLHRLALCRLRGFSPESVPRLAFA